MTESEINASVAKRMGAIGPQCLLPSYTTSYEPLAAAEREVYPFLHRESEGEPYTVQATAGGCDECSYTDEHRYCVTVFDSVFEMSVHNFPTELHARASVLARVIEGVESK